MNKFTFRKPKLGEELGSTIAVTAKESSVFYFTEKPNGKIGLVARPDSGGILIAKESIESIEQGLQALCKDPATSTSEYFDGYNKES